MYKSFERTLFRGNKTLRRIDFRLDANGIYLLAYQGDFLVAGISFQWPFFVTKNENLMPGLSCFSWDAQERIEYWTEMEKERDWY